MKITRRQLSGLIRKTLKESYEPPRLKRFSINPNDYINNDLDFEQLRAMIELILDADDIKYRVYTHERGSYDGETSPGDTEYYFGSGSGTRSKQASIRSYQAFNTLLAALAEAGIPHSAPWRQEIANVPSYYFTHYEPGRPEFAWWSEGALKLSANRRD